MSSPDASPARRSIRRAQVLLWAAYLGAAAFVAVCITASVYRSARAAMGDSPPAAAPAVTGLAEEGRSCLAALRRLHAELEAKLTSLAASQPGVEQGRRWQVWSSRWRRDHQAAGARCLLRRGEPLAARALRRAYEGLARLESTGANWAVQFAREPGRLADQVREALRQAAQALEKQGSGVRGPEGLGT